MTSPPTLKRGLSLPLITLYGVGTTLGAGIFVLVGKVAGEAGVYAPVAFLLASLVAAASALSFAELSARFPKSAGEAVYVNEGLRSRRLAAAVGLLVVLAGMVSCAAIANGFVGYLHEFIELPRWLALAGVILLLGGLAAWGITQAVGVAAIFTVFEVATLLVVIGAGGELLAELPSRAEELVPPLTSGAWLGIIGGAVLAFYAFLGFEDMVNVAEEVKNVQRTLPLGIILTLVITTLLYMAIALVAVLALPLAELAESEAPVALIFQRTTGMSPKAMSVVILFSVINGALIQLIMASRVLYGLGGQGWLPAVLARVHPRTRTPLVATAAVTGLALVFALWLPLVTLAQITSVITLVIFALINAALWCVKRRTVAPAGVPVFPLWVPAAGFAVSAAVALFQIARFVFA